jgi:hypothetical protein
VTATEIVAEDNIQINDMQLVKYLATEANVDLTSATYANTVFILVENKRFLDIAVTYATATTVNISYSKRVFFTRTGASTWSYATLS